MLGHLHLWHLYTVGYRFSHAGSFITPQLWGVIPACTGESRSVHFP